MTSWTPETLETDAIAVDVMTDGERLTVMLEDGRTISVPLTWYPHLAFATEEERSAVEIQPGGDLIEWPLLNEILPVKAFLGGWPSRGLARSIERWKERLVRRREALARSEPPEPWYPTLPLPADS